MLDLPPEQKLNDLRKMLGTRLNNNKKNINVTIANVISWYAESESCVLHNHGVRIPVTNIEDKNIVQSIIDKIIIEK